MPIWPGNDPGSRGAALQFSCVHQVASVRDARKHALAILVEAEFLQNALRTSIGGENPGRDLGDAEPVEADLQAGLGDLRRQTFSPPIRHDRVQQLDPDGLVAVEDVEAAPPDELAAQPVAEDPGAESISIPMPSDAEQPPADAVIGEELAPPGQQAHDVTIMVELEELMEMVRRRTLRIQSRGEVVVEEGTHDTRLPGLEYRRQVPAPERIAPEPSCVAPVNGRHRQIARPDIAPCVEKFPAI